MGKLIKQGRSGLHTTDGSGVKPSSSSYSAASNSLRWLRLKYFGIRCCLMTMRKKKSSGKRIPATGIHVIPKTINR